MITDQLVSFLPPGSNIAITNAAVASNIYDELGEGVGIIPSNAGTIIGKKTVFGSDMGIGGIRPMVECAVGTAFTTANAATLNVQFQGAIDNGAGSPGAWQTFIETGPLTAAQLTAGSFFGRFDWPPEYPVGFQPRFLRLNFVPLAATAFTAGTVAFAVVTMGRPDQANKFAASNFTVA